MVMTIATNGTIEDIGVKEFKFWQKNMIGKIYPVARKRDKICR